MDWKAQFDQKKMTLDEIAGTIRSGDKITVGPLSGFPLELVNAVTNRGDLSDILFYSGLLLTLPDFVKEEYEDRFGYLSFFTGPVERMLAGRKRFWPSSNHLSDITSFYEQQTNNASLIEVSPPDENGFMSIGPGSSLVGKSNFVTAKSVFVQINPYTPFLHGSDVHLHVNEVDGICEVNRPLFELPGTFEPDESDFMIAELIADRIENGATIQLGIGNLPNAIGEKLTDKKDLGVHTEMLTPSLINLYKKGVITGRKKTIHRDKMIAAFCIGTQDDYGFLHNNPAVEFHTTTYVNHPKVIAKNKNLVSVNNAISVDLTGQVASESIGFRQYSGTGGQLDFVRGAKYSEGGMSFIALKSTLDKSDYKKSRIVSFFPPGTVVTTPRADVQMIVTEYGIADLRNKTIPERVNQMISIAHPDFKEALAKEAVDSGLIPAGMIQEI